MLHQCLLQAPHSVPLVRALTTMATQNQPEVFFTFAGTPGAVSPPPSPPQLYPISPPTGYNAASHLQVALRVQYTAMAETGETLRLPT